MFYQQARQRVLPEQERAGWTGCVLQAVLRCSHAGVAPRKEEPMNTDLTIDPATIGWPATLPVEMALRISPLPELLDAYGIDEETWANLKHNDAFKQAVKEAVKQAQEEGFSYRVKAQMQAEALLQTSYNMIQDSTMPPAVRADLIKFTARVAGFDSAGKGPASTQAAGNGFSININLAPPAPKTGASDPMTITINPLAQLEGE